MIGKMDASDQPVPFALHGYGVLAVEGKEALAFLHAQAMNEVRTLADGQWQWNGVLSAKGRLLALFALLRLSPEAFLCILPDVDPAALEAHLLRFRFRTKVAFTVRADLHAAGCWRAAEARGAHAARRGDGGIELDFSGSRERSLQLLAAPAPADAEAADEWLREDLRHGLPRLPPAQHDAWTPQMLSLERLQAFSVKKGCYPGQEIVARTHFLGQAKRHLHLLALQARAAAGAEVQAGGQRTGELVCVAPADAGGQALALAVMAAPGDAAALQVQDAPAAAIPLCDGLAR